MDFIVYLSNYIIPFVVFYIVGYGVLQKKNVFDDFIEGAAEGFQVVLKIMPTLIGLMMGVGILRASGTLDLFSKLIGPITNLLHFPSELVPLVVVKMFSSSAASGLLLDVYKSFGTDSYLGLLASVLMSCSETIFYTMLVYFMTAGVRRSTLSYGGKSIPNPIMLDSFLQFRR